MRQTIEYYVRGYTGLGLVNYIESNISKIKDVYILKAANEKTATLFLTTFLSLIDEQTTVEILKHPDYQEDIDGIIIRDKSIAILTTPFMKYVSSRSHLIDLTKYTKLPMNYFLKERQEIINKTMEYVSLSLEKQMKIEELNNEEFELEKIKEKTSELINENLSDYPDLNKSSHVYLRLSESIPLECKRDSIKKLIAPITNKVYLEEKTGNLNTTILKALKDEIIDKGYDVEVYKDEYNPQKISLIIIREINHVFLNNRDLYTPLTHRKEAEESNELTIINKLNYECLEDLQLGISEYEKLQKFSGSLSESKISLNKNEVTMILKDHRVLFD